jgi:hypothetical protein
VVGLTREVALLEELTEDSLVTKDYAARRKSEEGRSMRALLDVLFLLAVLAVVISVYQFCPGQHTF